MELGVEGSTALAVTHINLNDHTVEGLKHRTLPIFAVQYHPEFKSKPLSAHPIFAGFVRAAIDRHLRRSEGKQPMLSGLQPS